MGAGSRSPHYFQPQHFPQKQNTMNTFPTLRARVIEDYIRENLLSGDECSKREILIKLLTKTDHSINFLAYVTECSMAYVRKIKKSINTSLTK